ncbi:MAG: GntR family transcriptional regulator [Alphaproteobacteria bacterium]
MSNATNKAYLAIRERILTGEFEPGSHLKEEELAEVCGVSRTPIRDALRSLAADLYVTVVPNHGTFVNDWSMVDIEDIFDLRAMLEGYAARRAAERATPEQIEIMRDCCDRIDRAAARQPEPDIEEFLAANRVLHQTLTEASGSERLGLMLSRLVEQPVVLRTAISYGREDLSRSNTHHRELVQALDAKDSKWAESVMVAHILSALQTYRDSYQREAARQEEAAE